MFTLKLFPLSVIWDPTPFIRISKLSTEARTGLSNNGKLACTGCLVSLVDFNFLPCLVECESPSPPKPQHLHSLSLHTEKNICAKTRETWEAPPKYIDCTARQVKASPEVP